MNIVKTGTNYKIFDNSVSVSEKLPNLTFKINFNPMSGFSLISTNELEVKEKIYGNLNRRVDKILNSFNYSNRNFGVILNGTKGCGKTLTARLVASRGLYPVILVDCYYPGIGDFLSSIQQEVIVIFDEFEKHFKNGSDDDGPQKELLSLFDGTDNGKKLFIITCNDTYHLNEFFINRPGRFHYLFTYNKLNNSEVSDYLKDNIDNYDLIPKIIKYSNYIDFTYDILRAICFDIKLGYPLEETMNELNIVIARKTYKVILKFNNNKTVELSTRCIPFSDYIDDFYFSIDGYDASIRYNCRDMVFKDNSLIIPIADIDYTVGDDDDDEAALPQLVELLFTESIPEGKFNFMMV